MSRHPGNPWWHQTQDAATAIFTRSEWDQALAGGFVTPEHVMIRLKNSLDHAFDNESHAGYDEDGFFVSLTAAGLRVEGGLTLIVYPNDHVPAHAHVSIKGHPEWKLRIDLRTAEFLDPMPKGLSSKKLNGFRRIVLENHGVLARWWEDYHGEPIVLG